MLGATALSAAGQVAGGIGQADSARAEARFANDRYAQNASAAMSSYRDELRLFGIQDDQADAQYSVDSMNNQAQGLAAVAGTRVRADSAGVGGNSVQALLDQYTALTARNEFALQTNRQWRRDQMREEMRASRARAQNRINSAAPGPVSMPSPVAMALQLGGTLLSGAAQAGTTSMQLTGKSAIFGAT